MSSKHDAVSNPSHYQTDSGLEAIEVIEAFFADNFYLANAFKYMARAGKKDDLVEDIEKAIWYLERYLSHGIRYKITPRGVAVVELTNAGIEVPQSRELRAVFPDTGQALTLENDGRWYGGYGDVWDTGELIELLQKGALQLEGEDG